jgi:hypothetical protein
MIRVKAAYIDIRDNEALIFIVAALLIFSGYFRALKSPQNRREISSQSLSDSPQLGTKRNFSYPGFIETYWRVTQHFVWGY